MADEPSPKIQPAMSDEALRVNVVRLSIGQVLSALEGLSITERSRVLAGAAIATKIEEEVCEALGH